MYIPKSLIYVGLKKSTIHNGIKKTSGSCMTRVIVLSQLLQHQIALRTQPASFMHQTVKHVCFVQNYLQLWEMWPDRPILFHRPLLGSSIPRHQPSISVVWVARWARGDPLRCNTSLTFAYLWGFLPFINLWQSMHNYCLFSIQYSLKSQSFRIFVLRQLKVIYFLSSISVDFCFSFPSCSPCSFRFYG